MKTFGHAIVAARKNVGLTQKAVAARLRRSDGRAVMPPYLNDLEHDRRHPPENTVIEQLAQVLNVSPDFLYFYARRLSLYPFFRWRRTPQAYRAMVESRSRLDAWPPA